jgi:hypothetical protein
MITIDGYNEHGKSVRIVIDNGTAKAVYKDGIIADTMAALGTTNVTRASHVEPHPTKGGWVADMEPSAGFDIVIGSNGSWFLGAAGWELIEPFPTRQAALDAERAWLRKYKGL